MASTSSWVRRILSLLCSIKQEGEVFCWNHFFLCRQYQLSHQPPSLEDTDPLMRNFADLKEVLNTVGFRLTEISTFFFLGFWSVRNESNHLSITILGCYKSTKYKWTNYRSGSFFCYKVPNLWANWCQQVWFCIFCLMLMISSIRTGNAVNSLADAVVHTKFIGGKSSGSDECVLFKILLVSFFDSLFLKEKS